MAGEGFVLQLIQSIKYNRSLKKTRVKREGPTPGMYTAATHNPVHSPEQVQATIKRFRKERDAESKCKPYKIALTIIFTVFILAVIIGVIYFLQSHSEMFEHQDIRSL
jgi:hypothetical protein